MSFIERRRGDNYPDMEGSAFESGGILRAKFIASMAIAHAISGRPVAAKNHAWWAAKRALAKAGRFPPSMFVQSAWIE
ncbi:hypothetical protein AU476_01120 [Cupriavidus sp. UYMSc13B]|nr:hypothetical protein AU476_01120 [Cupriavidus sp. UYMSc13B]